MNMDNWSPIILSLVTFIPLAGALLLTLLPRRDRDIRVFSLVVSLLTFVLSLHLPVHFHRAQAGFQYEVDSAMDSHAQYSLPPGRGWNFHVAGGADHLPHAAVRADFVEIDSRAGEGVLHPAAGAGNRDDRRVRGPGPVPFLLLLGSDADSDGAADRNVWPRQQDLCRRQILYVHHDCFGVHAGGDSVALCKGRDFRFCGHSDCDSQPDR